MRERSETNDEEEARREEEVNDERTEELET